MTSDARDVTAESMVFSSVQVLAWFLLYLCVYMCHGVNEEVRGQLSGVRSLSFNWGFPQSHSDQQAGTASTLSTEPSHHLYIGPFLS